MNQQPIVNGAPPAKVDMKAAGPFPWQQLLWTILGVGLPIVIRWIGDALSPGAPPTQPPTENP